MRLFLSALRYSILNVLTALFCVALLLGNDAMWIVVVAALVIGSGFDEGIGDGYEEKNTASLWIYNFNLYATVPALAVTTFIYLHHLTLADPLGFKALLAGAGIEFRPAIGRDGWGHLVAATIGTGYFYSLAGMTVAHELAHRTSRAAYHAARILLAFTLNASFAIAHVHGHHRLVATWRDPGSARRNEYSVAFAFRSTIGQHVEAFQIEKARLERKGLPVLSWHNRALTDQLYPLGHLAIGFLIAGWAGVAGLVVAGLYGSLVQKLVDYCQHYGLVRVEGRPVEERHSWDCTRFLSNAIQFNLPLHAHHHRAARAPFWELRPIEGAPRLPVGYQAAALLSLVPPLWHRVIDPRLARWDAEMANDEERALIRERGWEIKRG